MSPTPADAIAAAVGLLLICVGAFGLAGPAGIVLAAGIWLTYMATTKGAA